MSDHIYDFGVNIGGRQAIYMGFANTLNTVCMHSQIYQEYGSTG